MRGRIAVAAPMSIVTHDIMAWLKIDAASRLALTRPAVRRHRACSRCSPSASGCCRSSQHAKFEEMAENNHQRTLALRAPRGVVFDRDGQVLVENRHSYSISIVREHTKDLNRTIRAARRGARRRRSRGPRRSSIATAASRRYRPITIVQDATLAQVAAVTARRLDFELPDVVVEQVPTRQYPETMAAHLFGYVGEVSDAQVADDDDLKSGDIVGQAGIEKVYNALLMGEDGAKRVVVNSVGREIRTLEEEQPTEGKRLQLTIDYDVQKAIEDGVQGVGLQRRGGRARSEQRRGARRSPAVPAYDPNAFAAGHRSRDVGVAEHRRAAAAAGPRDPGPLFARVDVQDGGGAGRRSKKASSRPTSRCTAPGTRTSTAATSSAGRRAGHGIDRSAPRDRAVVRRLLLHRRATCSASTRSTSGRRCSASA